MPKHQFISGNWTNALNAGAFDVNLNNPVSNVNSNNGTHVKVV